MSLTADRRLLLRRISNDSWLRVQFDKTEARTLRVIHYVPFAVVIDVRTVGSFGTHWR